MCKLCRLKGHVDRYRSEIQRESMRNTRCIADKGKEYLVSFGVAVTCGWSIDSKSHTFSKHQVNSSLLCCPMLNASKRATTNGCTFTSIARTYIIELLLQTTCSDSFVQLASPPVTTRHNHPPVQKLVPKRFRQCIYRWQRHPNP
jgi:hypothetical protein